MGGSSKKVTVGYKYYVGMHMVFCHGPIDRFISLKCDDKLAWAGGQSTGQTYINQPELFGGESREGGIQGAVDFLDGGPSQGQNSYLAGKLGALVPNFRGVASIVFRQIYVGLNPYLKKWSAKIQRVHVRQNGLAQWYDGKAAIAQALTPYVEKNSGGWKYFITSKSNDANYSSSAYDDSAWPSGTMPFADRTMYSDVTQYGFNTAVGTLIASQSRGWYRKHFTVTALYEADLELFIDNLSKVWVNDYLVYEGGSEIDPSKFYGKIYIPSGLLRIGDNVIVVRHDDANDPSPGANNFSYANVGITPYTGADMNPAHIIRECLTDPDWGMGYQDADIDSASFTSAADTLYNERMGMSILWNTQTTIEEFIKVVVKHIDAALYVDRVSGKFVLKLIRNDYDAESLLVLNEGNIDKITDFTRPAFGELTNSVTVSYWDSTLEEGSTITVQDIALAQEQGVTINTSITYEGFTKADIAARVAQRDLKALSTPLVSCTIYANKDASNLNIGSVFKLTWPDYDVVDMVMRVTGIAYGDGKTNRIRIQCAQDVFSLPSIAFVAPPANAWEDPNSLPKAIQKQVAFEVPYMELVQQQGQANVDTVLDGNPQIGYAGIAASRPEGNALNARFYVDSGAGYEDVGMLDFCPGATLDAPMSKSDTTISITGGNELENVVIGSWCQIGNELMKVTGLSDTSLSVARGILDTVPSEHAQGSPVFFWDAYNEIAPTEYVQSEYVNTKLTTVAGSGTTSLSDAVQLTIPIVGRAARPYPPGKLTINASYFPDVVTGDIALTWAHRDRKQQTGADYIGFLENSIGPEAGTTYTVRFYKETGELAKTITGLTGTSYTWATEADDSLISSGDPNADGYYNDVSLSLHFNGADGSTSFPDSSKYSRAVTRNGNAVVKTDQYKFGGASGYFDGAGDYLSVAYANELNFNNSDFCLEGWARMAGTSGNHAIFDCRGTAAYNTSWAVFIGASDRSLNIYDGVLGATNISTGSNALPAAGTWFHWVIERIGTTTKMYIDGVERASSTGWNPPATHSSGIRIGINQAGADSFNGYMDDLRVTKRTGARYGAAFTPPVIQNPDVASYRTNGKVTIEVESVRDSLTSFQKQTHLVRRRGYGYNYGESYGN